MAETLNDRIQRRLKATGKSERGASLEAGLSDAFIRNIRLGKSKSPRVDTIAELARVLGTSTDWLMRGQGAEEPPSIGKGSMVGTFDPDDHTHHDNGQERVPLLGYVRAGAETYYYAKSDDPLDWVPPIENGNENTVAVQIQGTSLGEFFDTWLIYYDEVRSQVTPDMIGQLCVVGLMDDRVVVKKIKLARTPGFFNLISNNGLDDITDAEIIWAARVRHMAPR